MTLHINIMSVLHQTKLTVDEAPRHGVEPAKGPSAKRHPGFAPDLKLEVRGGAHQIGTITTHKGKP